MVGDVLVIRGARQHNLKNINVEIPKNNLVVITGLSGPGNRRWRSIRSSPRANDATSSR